MSNLIMWDIIYTKRPTQQDPATRLQRPHFPDCLAQPRLPSTVVDPLGAAPGCLVPSALGFGDQVWFWLCRRATDQDSRHHGGGDMHRAADQDRELMSFSTTPNLRLRAGNRSGGNTVYAHVQ
jgi:hypothetical protein